MILQTKGGNNCNLVKNIQKCDIDITYTQVGFIGTRTFIYGFADTAD